MGSISTTEILGALIPVLAVLGFGFAVIWKISDIRDQIKNYIIDISTQIGVLSTKLDEREKDITRLEGANEILRKDNSDLKGDVQSLKDSVKAIWETLTSIFPEKIPKRPKDTRS